MNNVSMVGRLVKDVLVRDSNSGAKVLFNRVAVRAQRKDEEDLFLNIVVFGRGAEVIGQYRTKGQEVGLTGRLRQGRPWTDANGNEHKELELVVNDVSLVGGSSQGRGVAGATGALPQPSQVVINPFDDDDIQY